MNTLVLPARPDQAPAPAPKSHTARWVVLGAVGMFIALMIIGLASGAGTRTAEPPRVTLNPAPSEMTRQEAMNQASPIMLRAADELDQITLTSAISDDVSHINNAADLTDEAAALFVGVDSVMEGYLSSAADHFRSSADAYGAGDLTTATHEMEAATSDLNSATALI